MKVDPMVAHRQGLERFLTVCRHPDDDTLTFENVVYAYLAHVDPVFFARLRMFYKDDASAVKWIDFFDIDLKQFKIDLLGYDVSNIRKFQLRALKKTAMDLLLAQQEYLFPLIEKMEASCV